MGFKLKAENSEHFLNAEFKITNLAVVLTTKKEKHRIFESYWEAERMRRIIKNDRGVDLKVVDAD